MSTHERGIARALAEARVWIEAHPGDAAVVERLVDPAFFRPAGAA